VGQYVEDLKWAFPALVHKGADNPLFLVKDWQAVWDVEGGVLVHQEAEPGTCDPVPSFTL
jgi:hypothetical protein